MNEPAAGPTSIDSATGRPSTAGLIPRTERIHELDALRGIAIALVMLRHSYPAAFGGGGIVGVEVFFVLSGYLITGILRRTSTSGRMDLRRFYRNRLVRLMPALVVAVLANAALVAVEHRGEPVLGGVVVSLLYLGDLGALLQLPHVPAMTHLWTLAVEEQFYLAWPAVLTIAARRRVSDLRLSIALVAAGFGALALTVSVFTLPEPVYSLPSTWSLALLLGGVLAFDVVRVPSSTNAAVLACVALAGFVVVPDAKAYAATYLVMVPIVALASMVLIANATGPSPLRAWRSRPLQLLGLISYSAYLWNLPLASRFPGPAAIALTLLVATASLHLIERPFARLRRP